MGPDGARYPTDDGFVPVPGGRLYFRSIGSMRAPPVLVVHGGPSDHRYLAPLADLVPEGFRVVWYDQWGCGRSTRPRSFAGYSIEVAAGHADAVRRRLHLGRPHLFGHSWGGALALEIVARYPHRYRSLAVSGGYGSDASFVRAMRRHVRTLPRAIRDPIEAGERTRRYDDARYRRAVQERRRRYSTALEILPYEFAVTLADVNRRLMRAVYGDRPGLFSPSAGILRGWDVSPRLPRWRGPTLVMAGGIEAGRFTARDLARALPAAQRVIFPGVGHLPFFQVRDRFVATLVRYYADVERRRPGPRGRRR